MATSPDRQTGSGWQPTPLGSGPVATVYPGQHSGVPIALKVYPGKFDKQTLSELEDEQATLAGIPGPGPILPVSGVELLKNGRHALRMELCTQSLAALVPRTGPLNPQDVATLGNAMALALAKAHGVGILHGGVKPTNVLFRASGEPVLADFGIPLRQAFPRDITDGIEWLPAESLRSDLIDEYTDLYGLGALMHYALTGTSPHPGKLGEQPGERVLRVLGSPVPAINRIDVPLALTTLIARLLAPDAERRPPSAAAVADHLTDMLSPQVPTPVPAPPPVAPAPVRATAPAPTIPPSQVRPPQTTPRVAQQQAPQPPTPPSRSTQVAQPQPQAPVRPPAPPVSPAPPASLSSPPLSISTPQPVARPTPKQAAPQPPAQQVPPAAPQRPATQQTAPPAAPPKPAAQQVPPAADSAAAFVMPTLRVPNKQQAQPVEPPPDEQQAPQEQPAEQAKVVHDEPAERIADQTDLDEFDDFTELPKQREPFQYHNFDGPAEPSAQSTVNFTPPEGPKKTSSIPRSRQIVFAVIAIGVLTTVVLSLILQNTPQELATTPRPQAPPASAPAQSSAPNALQLDLQNPIDNGNHVTLNWSSAPNLDYAVIVAAPGQNQKNQVLMAKRVHTMQVPTDPTKQYCFQIQATDGTQVYTTDPKPIRGAVCQE